MDTNKTVSEDATQNTEQRRLSINRLSLLLMLLMAAVAFMFIFTLLMGLLTNLLITPNHTPTVQVVFQGETHSKSSLSDVLVEPMKRLVTGAMHLMGFEKEHKSRRKRDLNNDDDNRIKMLDDNQLDRSEESEENVGQADLGTGIDGALQRLVQNNQSLKIVFAPPERDGNRNDIVKSFRKRRRRKRNAEQDQSLREKRYAKEYEELKSQYSRCKKEAPNEQDCDKIYEKLKRLSKEIKHNFKEMSSLIHEFKGKYDSDLKGDLSDSFPKKKEKKLEDKHLSSDSMESDERDGKTTKKDKPLPTMLDQATDSTTLQDDPLTTTPAEIKTTTEIGNVPEPFNMQKHAPVEDDCVKNLDDLLKKLPEFRGDEDFDHNCNETSTKTQNGSLVGQPEISKFNMQNLQYNPDEHRPKMDECIKSLDDLLEAIDLENGDLRKSKKCNSTTTTTAAPSVQRSAAHEEFGRAPYPFHEEFSDQSALPVEVHDFIMARSRNREQFNHDFPTTIEAPESRAASHMTQQTVAASGPFLNLCDQLRSQQNPGPIKTLSSNQHHFQTQQYGGLGQPSIPVTGETLKASSQVMLNSAYGGFSPNHFCFYQVPPTYGAMRPVYAGGHNYPSGVMNVPVNIHNLPGRRTADDSELQNAQLLCSLVVQSTTESSLAGNESSLSEPIVASVRARGHHRKCPRGKVPCADGVQCVRSSHVCDTRVDCFDGSDESHCSCLSRLAAKRRCDGYVDCPLGEDEMGCFGCDKFSFSCFNTVFEYEEAHHSQTKCFTLIEKCDGFDNCLNRKDEQDCTLLVRDLRSPLAFTVGHSVGVLHRNHKGKWYPVCHSPMPLAKEACESELGPLARDPLVVQHHGDLPGPFIQSNPRSRHVFQPEFTDTCNGLINYVKCPAPKCGSTKQNEMQSARIKIRGKRNASEMVQIVGGMKADPGAYPFIVAIFRDGKFHCGSSIINEHWVLTAAHCCDFYHKHYYELRAGLLRRRSFSPHVQVSTVTHVLVHHKYNPEMMMNDISLMHSDRPFQYNRWVRPICLPERHMTTNDRDWIWGPKPGTHCTAVGWGALREHGGSPDHLMHVTVPILPFCKHKNDQDGLEICAANESGGHDACQGDSGGPFVCVSISSPHEWYLAGVVSHGEGCARANEPGVYTRVALFIEWIHKKTREVLPPSSTRQNCPGFQCSVGTSLCLPKKKRCNGAVDCLGGEDELHCSLDQLLAESIRETTTVEMPSNSTTSSSTSTTSTTEPASQKFDFLAEKITQDTDHTSTPPTSVTNDYESMSTKEQPSTETATTVSGTTLHLADEMLTEAITITSTGSNSSEPTTDKSIATLNSNSQSSSMNDENVTTLIEITTSSTEPTMAESSTSLEMEMTTNSASPSSSSEEENATTTTDILTEMSTDSTTADSIKPMTVESSTARDLETTAYSTLPSSSSEEENSTVTYNPSSISSTTLSLKSSEEDDSNENTTYSTTESSMQETSTTTELNMNHTSTEQIWMQVNEAIANLKPQTPSLNREIEDFVQLEESVELTTFYDLLATTTTTTQTTSTKDFEHLEESVVLTTPDDLAMRSTTSTEPSTDATSTTTTDATQMHPASDTTPHDMDQSETQLESVTKDVAAEEGDQHPFLREIHELVEQKNKRLNEFRMSVHYLHTSMKNQSMNETYRYKRFVCSRIHQSINIAHHCDRIIDCEDGTDELRCTCKDYLKDKYDFLICDGKTDCLDLTDEEDCFSCEVGQYPCRMSKVCIDEKKLCDTNPDCPLHEDELDCLALTDGHKVYFDANNLSEFKYEGLVAQSTNGTWNLICGAEVNNKSVESIGKICSFLGFAGHRSYYQTVLEPLYNETIDLERQPLLIKSYRNITSEPNCKALHITCMPYINATEHEISHFENQHKEQPIQVNIQPINPLADIFSKTHLTFHENAHIEFIENFGDDYDWPWNADIYLEGVFLCSSIIIDVNWIVVDSSCMRMINLKHDFISVVAGGAKSYLKISGPYEQVVRVDCYHFLPDARVVMLHLEKNLTFTRHVLPTFIPQKSHEIEDNQCIAVGQDKYGRTRTLKVHMNMTNCGDPTKFICYQLDPDKGIYNADHCYSEDATRSGVVVCKTKLSGWYPVGFYQNKHGLCGFNEVVKMISLKEFYTDIQHVLSHTQCDYEFPAPLCTGLRCRYGKCIGHSLVCDNKLDCDDDSDERPEACNARNDTSTACLPTQFRCGNHQCIDKNKFCNGRNDCGDLSDEPHECSCYTYLKATDPAKICDGVRNCWDKTDENPRLCKCQKTSFHCGDSGTCIPYDHVCDGEIDCPGEEDERFCYALQQNPAETNYGEVMQQSHGIWHSKCFPKNDKYDDLTIKKMCELVGYHRVQKVYGRKMLLDSRLRTAKRTHDPVDRLRGSATKTVVLNKFSKVAINEKQAFYMKPSRPLFKLVNWDAEDELKCDRLEINCGD
ncbi:serine protease nudel [Ochlerotatus camptorhynchus]|uniref:serine protease nudel n=1 Tax=Ochlerotatus camptorhynchus TaxID=644619 RepID=UPI0031D19452